MIADVRLTVDDAGEVLLTLGNSGDVQLDVDVPYIGGGLPPYDGSYEADALFSEQVFATKNKSMTDDFTVHAINSTEAPNDYGVTVTIGG